MNKSLQVSHILSRIAPTSLGFTNTSQDINIQNMNIELVAQMFKNYQSNVLFHLEGSCYHVFMFWQSIFGANQLSATDNLKDPA